MSLEPIWEIERDDEGLPVRLWFCGLEPSLKEQEMTWREASAPIISEVIAKTGRSDMHLLRQRLREAFPLNWPGYWPRKIWRDEINRQLGLKPPLQRGGRRAEAAPEEQGRLWT